MSTEIPEYGQDEMAHPLPKTKIVDRIPWLVEQCRGKRVIHVGFADAGFRDEQTRAGRWLHGHLDDVATSLVGLDFDGPGVAAAQDTDYDAHLVDCTDVAAVEALDLEPADIVLAGEVIEHLGAPGPFLEAMARLIAPGGTLIVTTPNAYGLVNVVANITRRIEVNHPDHVVMFTWRTLTQLMAREGWAPEDVVTYVPQVRERGDRSRLDIAAVKLVAGTERLLGKLGRPYSADGLIVTAKRPPR
ncbi:MAG: methyltransferase domain-containing protein [Acidimicrobiales bacterium]|jgi:SAM-dependent methyltransferase|nr:methyltransferase domain-containing protein [Acidimicrobiales bacterium]